MVFTFGKYAGYALCDIPSTYLCYAVEEFSSLPEPLLCQCRAELLRRFGLAEPQAPAPVADETDQSARIKAIYRDLSKRYHPDRGGSTEAMQALNDFYRALTQ